LVKHSKRYSAVADKIEEDRIYEPEQAVDLVKEVSTAKFDESVELHLRTNVDPRHADQMVRGVAAMPHGLGKTVRFWSLPIAKRLKSPGRLERISPVKTT
jgi:large subunit ribosomal protein L1